MENAADNLRKCKDQGRKIGYAAYKAVATDKQKAVIAYGMTPMDLFSRCLYAWKREIASKWLKHMEIEATDENVANAIESINQDAVAEWTHGFTLGLLNAAHEAGCLIV